MEDILKNLHNLIQKINQIDEKKRNQSQSQLLQEINTSQLDEQYLLSLLIEENLSDGLNMSKKDLKSLSKVIKDLRERVKTKANQKKDINKEGIDSNKNIRYYRTKYENQKIIMLLKKPEGYTIPTEIFDFMSAIEDLQVVIHQNCTTNDEIDKFLKPLSGIAEVGGTSTYNFFAKNQLEDFKKSFVASKWWSIKLPFVKELAIQMTYNILVCYVLIIILKFDWFHEILYVKLNISQSYLINWLFVLIGSFIGTWISFSLFTKNNTIEELKSIRDNIPHPFFRLSIVALVASIFYLFFITGFFNLEIGDGELLSTKNIGEKYFENFALLIGILIGFSENSIGEKLRSRIESFTSKL